jgi:hypothetical protein
MFQSYEKLLHKGVPLFQLGICPEKSDCWVANGAKTAQQQLVPSFPVFCILNWPQELIDIVHHADFCPVKAEPDGT